MRVLIVDDHVDSVQSLLTLLKQLSHEGVRVANSAAAGLKAALEFPPDIVFMDVELPDMSGYEAALLMHQHPLLEKTRLFALTDFGEHPDRDRARTSGFERYIVKPITIEALQEVLGVKDA